MRIVVAFQLGNVSPEIAAAPPDDEDVQRICRTLVASGHQALPVEVSGSCPEVIEKLLLGEPDLVFNLARGTVGEAGGFLYPELYELLRLPFTGGSALDRRHRDRHLARTVAAARGLPVPPAELLTRECPGREFELRCPLILKPNAGHPGRAVTEEAVVETREAARRRIEELLDRHAEGVLVEEYIPGRELCVPLLADFPGQVPGIVEYVFDPDRLAGRPGILAAGPQDQEVQPRWVSVRPASLSPEEEARIRDLARKAAAVLGRPDRGTVAIRLGEDGRSWFLGLDSLASLRSGDPLMVAARLQGLDEETVLRLILRAAARRYGLALFPAGKAPRRGAESRPTARELGIRTGRLPTGVHNAITDVPGVRVGHVTRIEDDVPGPGGGPATCVRTGVTAILPAERPFTECLAAGGFVLSGIGEMTGLMQILELGWLETPILLTNSHSVGPVHSGVIAWLAERYPELGTATDVALPVVGETDDSFLNDVRVGTCTPEDAARAIRAAASGPVPQGSVGAGTGMMTFDFAGGIGTASRVLEMPEGRFTLGVLVQSNFGKMRNLTVGGMVVGRRLDPIIKKQERRQNCEGSVIVVVATDVPLLAGQLSRIARRAALGLGRAGSHATTASGEIVLAFSTANRSPRRNSESRRFIDLRCLDDAHIDLLYETAVETTEEAVLNAMFCSSGMTGRGGRRAPALPQETVLELLRRGRDYHESH